MANFEQIVRRREGVRLVVYLDSRRKPTVGIGHLVIGADKLKVGDKVTSQQVSAFFKKDGSKALAAARAQAGRAGIKDPNFLAYLASVNFQLGPRWYRVFHKSWKMILDGQYDEAAAALQRSAWFRQTPVRVRDFQKALRRLKSKNGGGGG